MLKDHILKPLLFSLGALSLILGLVGLFLPLLPTTPFVLLAAWCFLRSSEKAHQWLHGHGVLGPILRDWEKHRSISRRTKVVAILMILFSIGMIWYRVEILWIKVAVTLFLIGSSIFILTRNEKISVSGSS